MANTGSTRDKVAAILRREKGYISGETISAHLGISRAAVNGAVKGLRADGYKIDSVTNRGYRLLFAPDLLTMGEVSAAYAEVLAAEENCAPGETEEMVDERMSRVRCLATIDSTNRELAKMALEGAPDGEIVMADHQSNGRGRLGRSFTSPSGMGVYFSYLVRPSVSTSAEDWITVTSRVALAVSGAIERVCGKRPRIKWVNDLYLGPGELPSYRKVCGILTQMEMEPESLHVSAIIIGIGINVQQRKEDFPKELREIAGSLFTATSEHVSRAKLAAQLIHSIDTLRNAWPKGHEADLERYRKDLLLNGRQVTVMAQDVSRSAHVLGVEEDFALRVRFDDGSEESLRTGDITIRL